MRAAKSFSSLPNDKDGKPTGGAFMAGARGYVFGGAIGTSGPLSVPLEIRLARGQTWRGKVLDEKNQPLAGAQISVNGAMKTRDFDSAIFIENEALKAIYSTNSQDNGTFEIPDLPGDKNLFYRVTLPGFAPVTSQNGRVDDPQTFKLVRSGALRGRALDKTGKPLTNIKIYAISKTVSSTEISDLAPTDADGDFFIDGLPPGVYQLGIGAPANAPFLMPPSQSVRVEVGQTATAGEWRAIEGAEIRGFVTDAVTKKPIAGASFAAQNKADEKNNDDSAWATSDETGHFVLRVLAGDYRVRVGGAAPGYLRAATTQSAQPRDGAPAQIRFELKSAPIVRGITRDESGKPIAAKLLVGGFGGFGPNVTSDAQGEWQYTPQDTNDIGIGGGEDDEGYFEIVSPKRVDWPVKGPIVVTVRRHAWQKLAGRVVTPDGTPIEGAKIEAEFTVQTSDSGGYGARVSASSDKDGRYVLEKLRDSRRPNVRGTEVEVSAKKEGYQFQSGGKVTRAGNEPRVSNLIFVPLSSRISGTTQAGADVVAAGRQTRADDAGRFAFEALPSSENMIYAAKDDLFGSAPSSRNPLEIPLSKLEPQGRDENLAREVWAQNVAGKVDESVLDLDDWRNQDDFLRGLRRAQRSGNEWQIANALGQLKPTDSPESSEIAREILSEMAPSEARTGAYLSVALGADDAALTQSALDLARAQFEMATTDIYSRERQLYQAAVLTERQDGTQAGALALRAALAFTLKNRPAKSRIEGAHEVATGRNEALSRVVDIVALGSPALLRELLGNIESGSGAEVRARAEAIPIVARAHGFDAAKPLLEELRNLSVAAPDAKERPMIYDVDYALGYAVQNLIPIIGPTDAATSLELARQVKGDEQSARALASAARYQSLDVAASLLREAVSKISSEDAPRVAAYAYERDQKLGLELFEIARQKAETAAKSPLNPRNMWIPYAFYLARANPAQARLILEREWAKSREAKADDDDDDDDDDLAVIAIAMAPIDGQRAAEMARELAAAGNGWGVDAQVKIARYLVADEPTRRGFVLNRIGSREGWDAGELQW